MRNTRLPFRPLGGQEEQLVWINPSLHDLRWRSRKHNAGLYFIPSTSHSSPRVALPTASFCLAFFLFFTSKSKVHSCSAVPINLPLPGITSSRRAPVQVTRAAQSWSQSRTGAVAVWCREAILTTFHPDQHDKKNNLYACKSVLQSSLLIRWRFCRHFCSNIWCR